MSSGMEQIQALDAKKPVQEFDKDGNHRLVTTDGRKTLWAGYRQIAVLDGWVGYTGFYGAKEDVSTPIEFVTMIAVTDLDASEGVPG